MNPFLVGFYVFGVDFVLDCSWVKAAELEQNFDSSLVFCCG